MAVPVTDIIVSTAEDGVVAETTSIKDPDLGMTQSGVNNVLLEIISRFSGATYAGVATPETDPGTPLLKVFYLTTTAGEYTNFGNLTAESGKLTVLLYNGSTWEKQVLDLPASGGGSTVNVVQSTGTSTTDVMSQKTVTDELGKRQMAPATVGEIGQVLTQTGPNAEDVSWQTPSGGGGTSVTVVQETGDSTTDVMSQDAVTRLVSDIDDEIAHVRNEVTLGEGGTQEVLPSSIDEGKFLYTNNIESDSAKQNIANFDLSKLDADFLTITAYVSTSNKVGYVFLFDDGSYQSGSLYENGGSVQTHEVSIPSGATKLRFSYFSVGGINASCKISQSLKDLTLAIEKKVDISYSLAGANRIIAVSSSLTNGSLTIADAPSYNKKDCFVSVAAKISSYESMSFGLGYETTRGLQILIDQENVTYKSANSERFKEAHGLTISTFIRCAVRHVLNKFTIIISTISGTFVKEFTEEQLYNAECYGIPYIYADQSTSLTNVELSYGGSDFKCPIWIFGDSYTSIDVKRWPYYIFQYGFDKFMLNGLAGATSETMFDQVEKCLMLGTPKLLVWGLGMNDGVEPDMYQTCYNKLRTLCDSKGIELVLQTIPSVPGADKSAINEIIRNSGLRYVDVASAVGAADSQDWYDGYLDDGVHPTALGAKAIASEFLSDLPEIMQN